MTKVPRQTYSVAEYAKAMGVSERTVYRWLAGPGLTEGRDYYRLPGGRRDYRILAVAMPKGHRL
jgi:transposase